MKNYTKDYYYRYNGETFETKLKVFFQDFHKLSVNEDYSYPVHKHSNYELILTDKTEYECELNGEKLQLNKKELLLIKPGDWHRDYLKSGQIHYVLHFNILSLLGETDIPFFSDKVKPTEQVTEAPASSLIYLRELELEKVYSDRFSARIQDAIIETLFWKVIRVFPEDVLSLNFKNLSKRLLFRQKLFAFFEQHYKENIDIATIALKLGMSKRNLEYYCKAYLNIPPAKAFLNYRLGKAEELLIHTSLPIQEVSSRIGFNNQFHFSRIFKQRYGKSPINFRG